MSFETVRRPQKKKKVSYVSEQVSIFDENLLPEDDANFPEGINSKLRLLNWFQKISLGTSESRI